MQLRRSQWRHQVLCQPPDNYTSDRTSVIPGSEVWVQLETIEVRKNAEEVRCFWEATASPDNARNFANGYARPGITRGEDELPW
jgi:hypothetical protein